MAEVEEVSNKMQSQMRLHAAAAAAAAEDDDADDLPLPALFDRASRLHGLASSSALDQVPLPPPYPGPLRALLKITATKRRVPGDEWCLRLA
jgi:hypothetical protein